LEKQEILPESPNKKIKSNLSFGIYIGKKSENSSKTNSIFKPGLSVKCCFAACCADLTG
jgi:hypothetical protein